MTMKNVDWNAIQECVSNSLVKIHLDRSNLPGAFDVIRETIYDHLSIYIDKRHFGPLRVEIETSDSVIQAHLRLEGKTLCSWEI